MASSLKENLSQMNSTLSKQNASIDVLGTDVEETVSAVETGKDKTVALVKKRWTQTGYKWTVLFVVVCCFFGVYGGVMKVFSKRRSLFGRVKVVEVGVGVEVERLEVEEEVQEEVQEEEEENNGRLQLAALPSAPIIKAGEELHALRWRGSNLAGGEEDELQLQIEHEDEHEHEPEPLAQTQTQQLESDVQQETEKRSHTQQKQENEL
jgi:hypothetical protein